MQRWASFDCYGTLIDWDGGVRAELSRVFGDGRADELLTRYHEVEPELQRSGELTYREVLTRAMRQLGAPAGEEHGLAESLPGWRAFPEVHASLEELRRRGWRLAILSNTDADFIAASQVQIGVPFDEVVVAQELGSYKPAHRHWEEFFHRTRASREGHVHVAASLFHDIAPANELGLRSVWINRLGERRTAEPTRELPDLLALPETLDELTPPRP
ncbi:MAG TPA: HAD hydrolase-like protein [Gaiellaceae bacterium]|nr:HAD hydrolase-like protein [Gaiellaceae bacterium]